MRQTRTRSLLAVAASAVLAGVGLLGSGSSAEAATQYAPADTALIHPGTMMYTDGAQCTANFVYTDGAGNTYVGYAAHCAGKGSSTDTNGCRTDSVPLGTRVDFTNDGNLASEGTIVGHGTLAYSSWVTEHQLGTTDANTCAYNDLALVKVDAADVSQGQPVASRSGAARPASTPTAPPPATASAPTATPASAPASSRCRRTPASASVTTPPTVAGRTRSTP